MSSHTKRFWVTNHKCDKLGSNDSEDDDSRAPFRQAEGLRAQLKLLLNEHIRKKKQVSEEQLEEDDMELALENLKCRCTYDIPGAEHQSLYDIITEHSHDSVIKYRREHSNSNSPAMPSREFQTPKQIRRRSSGAFAYARAGDLTPLEENEGDDTFESPAFNDVRPAGCLSASLSNLGTSNVAEGAMKQDCASGITDKQYVDTSYVNSSLPSACDKPSKSCTSSASKRRRSTNEKCRSDSAQQQPKNDQTDSLCSQSRSPQAYTRMVEFLKKFRRPSQKGAIQVF